MNPYMVKEIHEQYWRRVIKIINSFPARDASLDDLWAAITYSEISDNFLDVGYAPPNYSAILPQGLAPTYQSSLAEYCVEKKNVIMEKELEESQLIVDLGSGWGRNAVFLAQNYPDKTILALEYSEAGVHATKLLAEKYNLKNIVAAPFDYNNPIALKEVVFPFNVMVDTAYSFSSFSIEQIPYVGDSFFLEVINSPFKHLTFLHFEPVGWQIKNIPKTTTARYNNDLFPTLTELESNNLIKIIKVEADIYGSGRIPGSKILWTRQ